MNTYYVILAPRGNFTLALSVALENQVKPPFLFIINLFLKVQLAITLSTLTAIIHLITEIIRSPEPKLHDSDKIMKAVTKEKFGPKKHSSKI